MTKAIFFATAAALALAACGDGADTTQTTNDLAMNDMAMANGMDTAMPADAAMPANGQEYATMAAASDMYEIESSQLALEKTQNAEVREFAQMLVTDHQKSTADLQAAAGQAQPAITVTPALNPEQQANMEALRGAAAADFDRVYIMQQIPAHEKALAMVQGYGANGDVEPLKQHATTVATPIQAHLQRARELQQSMGQ